MNERVSGPSEMSRLPPLSRPGPDRRQSRLIVIFLILALLIGLTGYLYYAVQKQQLTKDIQDELSAIADLKVAQIVAWRSERLADAEVIERNPVLTAAVRRLLRDPGDAGLKRDMLSWMQSLQETANYENVLLVDTGGRVRLSTSQTAKLSSAFAIQLLQDAMSSGQSIFSDFHQSPVFRHPHLALAVPLGTQKNNKITAIGALLIRINPETFLYPLVQSWPVASKSAETLLIRKEGDSVLFLNELRHRKNTALSFRIRLDERRRPAARALQQERGLFEGLDYREVRVLGVTRSIAQTPWLLVAKVDAEEIYAPIRRQAWLLSVVVAVLVAATGLSIIFWRRKELAEEHEKFYVSELARQTLSRQYALLSRYANDIVLLIDPAGNIREVNDRALQTYGYTREELLRLSIKDLRAPETRMDVTAQMAQVRQRHGLVFETVHRRKDGSTFPVEVSSRVIDEGGHGVFQSIIRDITERKRSEQALVASEQRYKGLIESVTDYIYSVEVENGRAVGTSHGPGCVAVTGYTSEEYHADPDLWLRMIFDTDRKNVIEHTKNILSGVSIAPFEHRIIHRDGSVRWIRNTPVPHYDDQGRLLSSDSLISDITHLKMLENQLRQAQKMEAVGQLAGGIAHDFNNILTAIIGYAHLLQMKVPGDDPLRSFVDPILSSAERAAHLTSSLLSFSRKKIVDLRPIDLNTIIRQVEHFLGRVIGEDIQFKLVLSHSDGELLVLVDSVQIEQVLMNLAANARDAMPDGGTLMIETNAITLGEEFIRTHSYGMPGRYACLSVTDTGIGMDETTRSRIFEPFFTTKEVGKGTGLGLSIVYGVIKQHHGIIDVASEPGKGTTFNMYLPLLPLSAVEQTVSAPKLTEWRGNETILLAEDDRTVRDITRQVLESAGYTVIEAIDGGDAVGKLTGNREAVDLVVLDMIMPGKNGREAYLEMKNLRPDIKALFTSGYAMDIVQKKGMLDPDLVIIPKPIIPSILLKNVREALDGK